MKALKRYLGGFPLWRVSVLCLLAGLPACQREKNSALALESIDPVYVLLEPSSLQTLNQKLGPSLQNYGEVKASDFVPRYKYTSVMRNMAEDLAIAVYTEQKLIPRGSMYMPVHPRQIYETVVAGKAGTNVIAVNPNASGVRGFLVTRVELEQAIPRLKQQDPVPLAIYVAK